MQYVTVEMAHSNASADDSEMFMYNRRMDEGSGFNGIFSDSSRTVSTFCTCPSSGSSSRFEMSAADVDADSGDGVAIALSGLNDLSGVLSC